MQSMPLPPLRTVSIGRVILHTAAGLGQVNCGYHHTDTVLGSSVSRRPRKLWFQGLRRLLAYGDTAFLGNKLNGEGGSSSVSKPRRKECLSLCTRKKVRLIIPYSQFSAQRTNQVLLWAAAYSVTIYKGKKEWLGFDSWGNSWLCEVHSGENPSSHYGPGIWLHALEFYPHAQCFKATVLFFLIGNACVFV